MNVSLLDKLFEASLQLANENEIAGLIQSNIQNLMPINRQGLRDWCIDTMIKTGGHPMVFQFARLVDSCPVAPKEEDLKPFISNLIQVGGVEGNAEKAAASLLPSFCSLRGDVFSILTRVINAIYETKMRQDAREHLITILIRITYLK